MLGRENKHFIVRLLKVPLKSFGTPVYHIVVAKKRSKPTSRLDRLGSVAFKKPYSFLRIDITKLTKYLLNKNVKIANNVWKVLGLDDYVRLLAQGQPNRLVGKKTSFKSFNKKGPLSDKS
jgi:hypothetical protein